MERERERERASWRGRWRNGEEEREMERWRGGEGEGEGEMERWRGRERGGGRGRERWRGRGLPSCSRQNVRIFECRCITAPDRPKATSLHVKKAKMLEIQHNFTIKYM